MAKLNLPKGYSTDFQNPRVKPVGDVEIDLSNSLSNSLIFGTILGDGFVDLAENKPAQPSSSTIATYTTINGSRARSFTTAANRVDYETKVLIEQGKPFTIMWRGNLNSAAGLKTVAAFKTNVSSAYLLFFFDNASYSDISWGDDGSGFDNNYRTTSIGDVTAAHTYIITYNGDASDTVSSMSFYSDGISQVVGLSGGLTGSNQGTSIGERRNPTGSYDGDLEFLYVFDKDLSSVAKELNDNPYQIIKPKTPAVYYTAGASGAITVNAESQAYNVNFFDATVDFTGLVAVSAESQSHSVTFYDAVMDFTGEIAVTTATQDYDVTFFDATIGLVGGISVNTQVQAVNVDFHAATIGLFGVITVGAQKQSYSTTFYNVSIAIADVWTDKPPAITNWTDK